MTSFCQLLERRYAGQLDERGDQYIDFAVDGAKRMQALINDLLAFSRVGRHERPRDARRPRRAGRARHERPLAGHRGDAAPRVEVDAATCPRSRASARCSPLVLQNLIANAIKFHGDDAAGRRVSAPPRRPSTGSSPCTDNGIGIEPEYADRIFVIFQRLHARDAYAGTGIGLAMCRKIVEYHGGRIWLEPSQTAPGRRSGSPCRSPDDIATEEAMRMNQNLNVDRGPAGRGRSRRRLITREAFEHHKVAQPAARGLRRRRGARVPAPRGRVRRRAAPGPDPARPQPPPQGRPRGARRDQGGRGPAHDPGRRADHLGGRGGHRCAATTCTRTPT